MKSLNEFQNSNVRFVFTDIDDTLTDEGRLHPDAFHALWQLSEKNIHVVPVTGRPAGWCELIARQWPVAGVIGENGGFYFRLVDRNMKRHFVFDSATRADNQKKLERIRAEVLTVVPGCRVASDQFGRMMDLAIDYCEDVEPLPKLEVDKIVGVFEKHGAIAKISSIHVNGWFGQYDKLSMCKTFCEKEFGVDLNADNSLAVFVGDSPNDEPMFQFFNYSCAVANVQKFLKTMPASSHPKFVAELPGGRGFQQVANRILAIKK